MATSAPAITISILTHNYARYLRDAIESVVQQDREDWELFICDDASTDETPEIVKPYLADERVTWLPSDRKLGQAGNWARALGLGTAPVVGVLHADDRWLPGTLSTVLPLFEAEPELDFVYGNWKILKEGEAELAPGLQEWEHAWTGTQEFAHQISRNRWLPSATFERRSLVAAIGPPHPTFHMVVDVEFHLRAAAHARRVRALSKPLIVYRVHDQSTSAKSYQDGVLLRELQELPGVVAAWARKDPKLSRHLRVFGCSAAETVYSMGVVAVLEGDIDEGKRRMQSAIRLCPELAWRSKVLPDRVLLRLGPFGRRVFRYLHRKSFRTPRAQTGA